MKIAIEIELANRLLSRLDEYWAEGLYHISPDSGDKFDEDYKALEQAIDLCAELLKTEEERNV